MELSNEPYAPPLNHQRRAPFTEYTGGWVNLRVGLGIFLEKIRMFSSPLDIELSFLSRKTHYTEQASLFPGLSGRRLIIDFVFYSSQ